MTSHIRRPSSHQTPAQTRSVDTLLAARKAGDPRRCRRAEDAMVVAYLSLADVVAHRYRHRGVDFDDLEQVARVGLIKAVRRWDPRRGAFLGYALPTIEGEVKRHFRDSGSTIRVPRALYEAQPQVTAAQRALRQELSHEPTIAEIAERAGIPEHRVREVQETAGKCQPLSTDDGADGIDVLRSDEADEDLSMVVSRAELRPALSTLSDKEQRVLALRFVWGQSQLQIATSLGVSQMQISRVLRAALDKLRDRMEPLGEQPG